MVHSEAAPQLGQKSPWKLHERQEEGLFPELLRQAQENHHSQGWYFHQVPSDTQAVTNIALLLGVSISHLRRSYTYGQLHLIVITPTS